MASKNTESTPPGVERTPEPERTRKYFQYLVEKGHIERFGYPLAMVPEHLERAQREYKVVARAGFCSYFIILASIMDFCRRENIPYAPGRGSVGGSFVLYLAGIHEVNPLEWGLIFERFMTADRVSFPDVDLDFSQEQRQRVIDFTRDMFASRGDIVLQVGAFQRAGGRSTIENVLAAMRETDPNADSVAYVLRSCLPERGNITGGTKQARELDWWLENGHGDKDKFRETAITAGWMNDLMKLDGMYTGLTRHAAGVVILSPEDAKTMPQCSPDGEDMVTGFDMHDLDELRYLKYDYLGLRTLDVIADAHKAIGGSGDTRDLMTIWAEHRDDREPYRMLCDGDTLGIFQMETDGYRRTLKRFRPEKFDHIVQLNALYRPGALDYKRPEDGKNMVDVFIERRHGREPSRPPAPELGDVLRETFGIFLYQEQAMRAVQILAGFDGSQADLLRKGIGKKKQHIIDELKPLYYEGCKKNGIAEAVAVRVWENIEAAARYSWNKSHSVFYGIITWLTVWFKFHHPAAFYGALFNSYDDKKERLSEALSEARQRVTIAPPNINVARADFVSVPDENTIVFGLNGVRGMGEAGRRAILNERATGMPFGSFTDFCNRMVDEEGRDTLDIGKKRALIKCGAFDDLDDRSFLLATCRKPGKGSKCSRCEGEGDCPDCVDGFIPKIWSVAEHINHNRKIKTPRPIPPIFELEFPSNTELSAGEVESIGFYISTEPLAGVAKALERAPKGNHIGGEIEKVYIKTDRRGDIYASLTLLTPALNRQRVIIFASNWERLSWVEKGMQVLMRGRLDGSSFLADAVFECDDVRHFKKIVTERNGERSTEDFLGDIQTVRDLEAAGYNVRFL
jgi:DNA polymerase III subunit alpha